MVALLVGCIALMLNEPGFPVNVQIVIGLIVAAGATLWISARSQAKVRHHEYPCLLIVVLGDMARHEETVLNGNNDQIRRMQSLLRDFKPLLDRLKDQRRQTASRFNVAEAFGVTRDELAHSQFIAYLLNPKAYHDQGDAFLTSFLNCLKEVRDLNFSPASTQGVSVNTEVGLGSYGRIDIHIRLANGQIILLENKVGQQEDPCQISRYQEWLQRQDPPLGFLHQLVFLTPEGRRPVSTRKPEEVICLSYARLADWLSCSLQEIEAQRLRIILEQYAETCRHIGGSTRRNAMPNEIRQFFLDPERLEAALEIERHLPDVKRGLHETFWREVMEVVEVRLTELPINDDHAPLWEIQFNDPLFRGFNFGNFKGWRIAWRDQPHYFAVKVEFWPGRGLFYGITRGAGIQEANQVQQDRDIRKRLHGLGFVTRTNHYPGLRFFRDHGLPRFDLSRVDDVLELAREMQNDDRPLVHRVVDSVWGLFCGFRQELEALNRKYPYG